MKLLFLFLEEKRREENEEGKEGGGRRTGKGDSLGTGKGTEDERMRGGERRKRGDTCYHFNPCSLWRRESRDALLG